MSDYSIDATGTNADPSPLDLLAQAVNAEVAAKDITLAVPDRPFRVRYTLAGLSPAKVQRWLKAHSVKGDLDTDAYNARVLAEQCAAIYLADGTEVLDDGEPVTFRSQALRTMTGESRAVEVVRVVYGGPEKAYGFSISQHANLLQERAGLGERAVEDDDPPT